MKTRRVLLIPAAVVVLAAAGPAFGHSAHKSTSQAVVKTANSSLGTILVTGSGQTLYLDSGDKPGHPACTGGCLTAWPPLRTSGAPKASGGAKASDLGTVKAAGGKQVTYHGHPLYTFASAGKGTSGEGVSGFYVVSPSGSEILKKKPGGSSPGY